jgi:two-component system, LytTR family, sensor histidine kinase AlgZ
MTPTPATTAAGKARTDGVRLRLPDFCSGPAMAGIFLIIMTTALVLSLARQSDLMVLWLDLTRTALMLLWIGLGSAAALCKLRTRLEALPIKQAVALAMLVIMLVVTAISAIALLISNSTVFSEFYSALVVQAHPWRFLLTNMAIGAIIGGLTLRYFYVQGEWQRNVELQARARVFALQARIRPHFLYNSLNTIAALTTSNPQQAEAAVQDLADLFRANLNEQRGSISLKEELEVARIYQRIEQLRLGERLQVVWDIATLPMRAQVPSLLLQPLLENAIFHGIEPRRDGGKVRVSGELDGEMIVLTVSNPLPEPGSSAHSGNGVALANIRERLMLVYQGKAQVEAGISDGEFAVRLQFPKEIPGAEAAL